MKALSEIVAENLIALRKKAGLTQQDLADQLAYSDKTVSKWELGKAIPSVDVLKELADFYGVTVDYLISENNAADKVDPKINKKVEGNRIIVLFLIATIVYLIATVVFVWTLMMKNMKPLWQIFVWATSLTALISAEIIRRRMRDKKIVWLVLASVFVWTLIAAFYLQFLEQNVWYIFIVGVPIQILLVFLMMMRKG
jgi:transcriptional regulator with XRE-family HTH domain